MKLQLLHPIAGLTDRPLSVADADGAASTPATVPPVTTSTVASPAKSLRLNCGRIRSSYGPLFFAPPHTGRTPGGPGRDRRGRASPEHWYGTTACSSVSMLV